MPTLSQGAAPNVVAAKTSSLSGLQNVSLTLSPALVAANTTAEQTFTLTGVASGDVVVSINKPTAQAGLGIVGWRVSAANQIGITFSNNTAAGITPTASQVYLVTIFRSNDASTKTTFDGL